MHSGRYRKRLRLTVWLVVLTFFLTSIPNLNLLCHFEPGSEVYAAQVDIATDPLPDAEPVNPAEQPQEIGTDEGSVDRASEDILGQSETKNLQFAKALKLPKPFTVNGPYSSGAAAATIPIEVPAGRPGLTPDLTLYYNSMHEIGWLGRGWGLELGAIERRGTEKGDVFYFVSGNTVEQLVEIARKEEPPPWIQGGFRVWVTYILKSNPQAIFNRLQNFYKPDILGRPELRSESWDAQIGGLYYIFGVGYGENPSDPSYQRGGSQVFLERWSLESIVDSHDNRLEITYQRMADGTGYPAEVIYNNKYRALLSVDRELKCLTDITLFYGDLQVSRYHLEYESSTIACWRLKSVTRYGSDNQTTMPSITLGWVNMGCKSGPYCCEYLETLNTGQGGQTGFRYIFGEHGWPVVEQITIADGQGNEQGTTYKYKDGRNRKSTGLVFEEVTETRPDGSSVTSRYHVDSSDAFIGYLRSVEERGVLHAKTNFFWENRSGSIYLTQTTTSYYDEKGSLRGDPAEVTYKYDDHGNLIKKSSSRKGRNPVIQKTEWVNVKTPDLGAWWRPKTEVVIERVKESEVRQREKHYRYNTYGDLFETHVATTVKAGKPVLTTSKIESYDQYGNPTTVIDFDGNRTTIEYDPDLHLYPSRVSASNTGAKVIAHTTTMTYDPLWGKVASSTDENGRTTGHYYDVFGRLQSTYYPDGGAQLIEYRDKEIPRRVIHCRNNLGDNEAEITSIEFYDGLNRLIQKNVPMADQAYSVISMRYNNAGQKHLVFGPYVSNNFSFVTDSGPADAPKEEFFYDDVGRLAEIRKAVQGGEACTHFDYDLFKQIITDPDGHSKTIRSDDLGRVIEVTDAHGKGTQYRYNAAGDLLKITGSSGTATTMEYDLRGKKVSHSDPDRGKWLYGYDNNGNLKKSTGPDGQVIEHYYDELNRIIRTESTVPGECKGSDCRPGETIVSTFTYDGNVPNGLGRLHESHREGVTRRVTGYDPLGRVAGEETIYIPKNIWEPMNCYRTKYTYDLAGHLVSLVYPNEDEVTYRYIPGTDLISQVVGPAGETIAQFDDYYPNGQPVQISYGNGVKTTYRYDPTSMRLQEIKTTSADNKLLQGWEYAGYSGAGDILETVDCVQGFTYRYQYDGLHRLVNENTTSGKVPINTLSYSYDQLGNLTEKTENSTRYSYEYGDAAHPCRLRAIHINGGKALPFSYDQSGNVVAGPIVGQATVRNLTYGADGMPVSVTADNASSTFAYDANGIRAIKKTARGKTYSVSSVFEVNPDGSSTQYISAGNRKLAKITGKQTVYFHHDHLGSATLVTDSSGKVLEQTRYMPFGNLMPRATRLSSTAYQYTGQEYDPETGLYNYKARYYDPAIGRFIMPDPVIPDPYNAQSLNPYSYVNNNPLKYTDPSGHMGAETDPLLPHPRCTRCCGYKVIIVTALMIASLQVIAWRAFKSHAASIPLHQVVENTGLTEYGNCTVELYWGWAVTGDSSGSSERFSDAEFPKHTASRLRCHTPDGQLVLHDTYCNDGRCPGDSGMTNYCNINSNQSILIPKNQSLYCWNQYGPGKGQHLCNDDTQSQVNYILGKAPWNQTCADDEANTVAPWEDHWSKRYTNCSRPPRYPWTR